MSLIPPMRMEGWNFTLHHADFRGRHVERPLSGYDAVITAPKWYEGADLGLAEELGYFSDQVLRGDGNFLVIAVGDYLEKVMPFWERYFRRRQEFIFELPAPTGETPERWPIVLMTKHNDPVEPTPEILTIDDAEERFYEYGVLPTAASVLVKRFTRPGDRIMDPLCWRGSVGIAALMTGRRFVGLDTDEEELIAASLFMSSVASINGSGLVAMY